MQAEEAKAQLSALMRNEAELLAQRSRDTLQALNLLVLLVQKYKY